MVQRIHRTAPPAAPLALSLPSSGPLSNILGPRRPSPTVSQSRNGFRGLDAAYLVHGIGRRAIRVVVRPFLALGLGAVDEEKLAVLAAARANRKGWKTIVVMPDPVYGDDAETMNWTRYRQSMPLDDGEFLASAESIAEDWP